MTSKKEALFRINAESLEQLLHPTLDPNAKTLLTKGLPASPGAASEKIVFDADEAEKLSKLEEKVILVRTETSPETYTVCMLLKVYLQEEEE